MALPRIELGLCPFRERFSKIPRESRHVKEMGVPRIELGNYPRQGYSLPLAYTPFKMKGKFNFLYLSCLK